MWANSFLALFPVPDSSHQLGGDLLWVTLEITYGIAFYARQYFLTFSLNHHAPGSGRRGSQRPEAIEHGPDPALVINVIWGFAFYQSCVLWQAAICNCTIWFAGRGGESF